MLSCTAAELANPLFCWPWCQPPCWLPAGKQGIGWASATPDKPTTVLGHAGKSSGEPLQADRLTCFLLFSIPSASYQTEVPSKQEFHTLLTMWLLSAAASATINRGSSFRLLLVALSVSSCLILILQGGGSTPLKLWKEKSGCKV